MHVNITVIILCQLGYTPFSINANHKKHNQKQQTEQIDGDVADLIDDTIFGALFKIKILHLYFLDILAVA